VQLASPQKIHAFNLATQPSSPPFSVFLKVFKKVSNNFQLALINTKIMKTLLLVHDTTGNSVKN